MINKEDKKIVSYPNIGNYYAPIYSFLKNIFPNCKIMVPTKTTKKTQQLGEKYSPDSICTPFKYTLGSFIESLDRGANVILQGGGGCKFGYYAELQEQILRDMGYDFIFITALDGDKMNVSKICNSLKSVDNSLTTPKLIYQVILTVKLINFLDKCESYIRDNISYEVDKGNFEKIHQDLLKSIMKVNTFGDYKLLKAKYNKLLKNAKLRFDENMIKIGIVGELYSCMDQFANFLLEKQLADMNVAVKRYTTATYLLFEKGKKIKDHLKNSKEYIKYELGADGTESVSHSLELCKKGYDGIIHVKPFGCTPEINAMPILQKISEKYNVPIMYLTFDMQTSETGIRTRLEAFYDMIKMKSGKGELNCQQTI